MRLESADKASGMVVVDGGISLVTYETTKFVVVANFIEWWNGIPVTPDYYLHFDSLNGGLTVENQDEINIATIRPSCNSGHGPFALVVSNSGLLLSYSLHIGYICSSMRRNGKFTNIAGSVEELNGILSDQYWPTDYQKQLVDQQRSALEKGYLNSVVSVELEHWWDEFLSFW